MQYTLLTIPVHQDVSMLHVTLGEEDPSMLDKTVTDDGYDIKVAAALGDACQAKVVQNSERFCSDNVRKLVR